MPLREATMSELKQTLPEFTARYREFKPYQDVRLDFPDEIPVTPEPVPITPEEVHMLMGKQAVQQVEQLPQIALAIRGSVRLALSPAAANKS